MAARKIMLYGESGHGKTSSIRNLPPEHTGIINSDKKELPLQGWEAKYKTVIGADGKPDLLKSNYVETAKFESVKATIEAWNKREDIHYVVLDTFTHLISYDYVNNAIGKEYKDYMKMGGHGYAILDMIRESPKNWLVIGHSDTQYNQDGVKVVTLKTQGKMINGFVPPSFFTTVLVPVVERSEDSASYMFRTQSDGNDAAKSPAAFGDDGFTTALPLYIENDIKKVFDILDEFYKNPG